MNKMKMLLFTGILLFSIQTIAQQGQRQPPPVPERVTRTIDRLKPDLKLTDQQVKDLDPIYTEFYTKMDSVRATGQQPTPEDRKKLIDGRDEKLKKVLDEAQMKKLKELEEEMRKQREARQQ